MLKKILIDLVVLLCGPEFEKGLEAVAKLVATPAATPPAP